MNLCLFCALTVLAQPTTTAPLTNAVPRGGNEVVVSAPMLVCHELTGGVRPPVKPGETREHDLVFFVVSGRRSDGTVVNEVAPRAGAHLKIDNDRNTMILKNVQVWRGKLGEGEAITLLISLREQDGKDSAEDDLKEARQIAEQVDNDAAIADVAKTPVSKVLNAGAGENDHIGTVAMRLKRIRGEVVLQTATGDSASYLKGHAINHPKDRSFKLDGDHSDYRLHLHVD
jgi:hypothetical protein